MADCLPLAGRLTNTNEESNYTATILYYCTNEEPTYLLLYYCTNEESTYLLLYYSTIPMRSLPIYYYQYNTTTPMSSLSILLLYYTTTYRCLKVIIIYIDELSSAAIARNCLDIKALMACSNFCNIFL